MTLRLPPGRHLLRLTAMTAANCGDAGGSAAVDRPVAVDAWRRLPYLPASSLKGVLAGRFGNVERPGAGPVSARLNRRRVELFGAPDDDEAEAAGAAGRVVFGDGEPLAFPLLLPDGRRARVVVAETIYRLARLGLVPAAGLRRVEPAAGFEGALAWQELPALPLRPRPARFGVSRRLVAALAGPSDAAAVDVLAAPDAARELWRAAVDERTLTALGSDRRVRPGSLRRVELIPAGSVFVSLVSHLGEVEADLGPAAPLQLGAWESVGHGLFAAEVLGAIGADELAAGGDEAGADHPGESRPPAAPAPGPRAREDWQVMTAIYQGIAALVGRPEAPRVRSAVFDLGLRLRRWGLPATLAFCLAKAAPARAGREEASEKRSAEGRAAYRWLLERLFELPAGSDHAAIHRRVRGAVTGEEPPPPGLEATALWLRRYAETLLPPEARDG